MTTQKDEDTTTASLKTVEFIHTSMMNDSVFVEFKFSPEQNRWISINPDEDFGTTTFEVNEIRSVIYWS